MNSHKIEMDRISPVELRARCREGAFTGPTSGLAVGFVHTNLVILPMSDADEFRAYCAANPRPCPLFEQLLPGDPKPRRIAPGADVRTDLPCYRVFRDGKLVDEPTEITRLWREDLVTFLIGCSFIAEEALINAGLVLSHIAETGYVPMYRTGVETVPAGRFCGPMVVSMRPLTPADAVRAAEITSHYPMAHGGPIHKGNPETIGICDINRPEFGRPVTITPGAVPVFWACGVTTQEAIRKARPSLAITHKPGCMFVADVTAESTWV